MLSKVIKKAEIVLTTYVGDNRQGDNHKKDLVSTDTATNLSGRKRKQLEREKRSRDIDEKHQSKKSSSSRSSSKCKHCGRTHGGECRLKLANHPDCNMSNQEWDDSEKGIAWKKQGKDSCAFDSLLDGKPFNCKVEKKGVKSSDRFKHNKKNSSKFDYMSALEQLSSECYTVPIAIRSAYSDSKLNCQMLIDTGSLQSNYVNLRTAEWLRATQTAAMDSSSIKSPTVGQSVTSCLSNCLCLGGVATCNSLNNTSKTLVLESIDTNSAVVQRSGGRTIQKSTSKYKRSRSESRSQRANKKPRGTASMHSHTTPKKRTGMQLYGKSVQMHTNPTCGNKRSDISNAHISDVEPNSKRSRVCSGITGLCTDSPGEVTFSLTFYNEKSGMKETIPNMVAKILDTPYDFILGRPDIQKYDMLAKNMSQFHAKSNDIESMLSSGHTLKARKRRVATKESHTASSLLDYRYDFSQGRVTNPGVR